MSNCLHCERPVHLRGMCIAHYRRFMIYGNALEPWHRPVMGTCSECDRPAKAKGLRNAHYKKLQKYGDPLAGGTYLRGEPPIVQYLAKVDKRGPDECWPWTAYRDPNNYGHFTSGKESDGTKYGGSAHRYGFEQFVRPLEPGEQVDHICHNRDPDCPGGPTCGHRACQNPAHWEAVTHAVNVVRASSTRNAEIVRQRVVTATATRRLKTHCRWGHDTMDPANSYGYGGRRVCKICARLAARGQHPRQLLAQGRLF